MAGRTRRLYNLLGVGPDADDLSVRRAYQLLATQHAPDANPGDPRAAARVRAVRQAWDVLGDPDRRALYDEFGEPALESGFDPEAARLAAERELRRAEQRRLAALVEPTAVQQPSAGGWRIEVAVGRTAARRGQRVSVKVLRPVPCPKCRGAQRIERPCATCDGARKVRQRRLESCVPCRGVGLLLDEWAPCRPCGGRGRRRSRACPTCGGVGTRVLRRTCVDCAGLGLRVFWDEKPCAHCADTGRAPCPRCGATGSVGRKESLRLRVPRGARDDVDYRYAGAGFGSASGEPGDLLVRFVMLRRAPARRHRRRRRW